MALQKLSKTGMSQALLIKAFNEVIAWCTEADGDFDTINNLLHYARERDGVIGGNFTLGVGTGTTTKICMSGTCRYRIDGVEYSATDVEGAFAQTDDVTANGNGAWRILLGKTGALTVQRATADGTGAMNFTTAEQALLSLAQLPRTADTAEIGYLMIHATNGQNGFTPNTDDPATTSGEVDVATYYNVRVPHLDNGFTATPSVGLSVGTTTDEYAFGTINVRTNGLNVAQIAADVTITFAQADIITTLGNYGGHLFVTDTAGTAVLSLAATGIAGSAQTMDYTLAEAITALNAIQAALPLIFTVIGRETCLAAKATFTYDTDAIDGTALKGLSTFTDEVFGEFDRTVVSGTGIKNDSPTIPGTVTAPILSLSEL